MWGKLTERSDRRQTRVITEPKELYVFLASPDIEVMNMTFVSDDVVWLSWKHATEEQVQCFRHPNEVIGAYVTAGARIHLYRYLVRLQERAIYCDTESVIYVQTNVGPQIIETGDKLWDMNSELKPSELIHEFVSGGRKNYAYRVKNIVTGRSKTVCKFRGITLNYNTSQTVNFDVMKGMILGRMEEPVVTVHTEIKIKRKRTGGGGRVSKVTEPEDKMYRITFFKSRRLADNTSVTFGYK
jgi:hypothetical protein